MWLCRVPRKGNILVRITGFTGMITAEFEAFERHEPGIGLLERLYH